MAISATTSALRDALPPLPVAERELSFSAKTRFDFLAANTGARPVNNPVPSVMAAAKNSTRQSKVVSASRGMSRGPMTMSTRDPHCASRPPAMPPSPASSRFSVSSCLPGAPAGAYSRADGHLARPRSTAGHQQAGHIGARDDLIRPAAPSRTTGWGGSPGIAVRSRKMPEARWPFSGPGSDSSKRRIISVEVGVPDASARRISDGPAPAWMRGGCGRQCRLPCCAGR